MRELAYRASLLMIFMMPWEGVFVLPGLGTASRLMGLIVGGLWLASVLQRGAFRKLVPFHVLIFGFFLWNALSLLWSVDPDQTLLRMRAYVQMAGMIVILWDLYTTPAAVKSGLQAYVLGLYVPVMSTVSNYLAGNQSVYGRYSSSGDNANTTGLLISIGLPLAWYLATSASATPLHRLWRVVNFVYIPAGIFAILLTATRFAVLMTIPFVIYSVASLSRLRLRSAVLVTVFLLGGLAVLSAQIPESSLQRIGSVGDELSEGDLNGRTRLWGYAFEFWMENPVLGIGSDSFHEAVKPVYGRGRSAHNSYVEILAELGVVGFLLFGAVTAAGVAQAWRLQKWDSYFWLTVLAVWMTSNMALTLAHTKVTWLLFSLLIVTAHLPLRQASSAPTLASR